MRQLKEDLMEFFECKKELKRRAQEMQKNKLCMGKRNSYKEYYLD